MKNILLLGATGFAGQNVANVLKQNAVFNIIESSRSKGVDLISYDQTLTLFKNSSPDYIINCAAHVGSVKYISGNGRGLPKSSNNKSNC